MNPFLKIIYILTFGWLTLHAEDYTFGEGWQIADTPVIVGGYFSSEYGVGRDSRYYGIDDIAVMTYGEFERFGFLAEFEASDFYAKETGLYPHESSNTTFRIERLYGDYHFDDDRRIRIGKFNSDVGFWNQMPINVLRETTSSPSLVKDFFPKLTSGVHYEVQKTGNGLKRMSMTLQHNDDIDADYNNFNVDRHYAVGFDLGTEKSLWRFGGGYFRYVDIREAVYALGAYRGEYKQWNFLLESVLRREMEEGGLSYDVYAQGAWHFQPKHALIFRAEVEKEPLTEIHDKSALFGYTYRPLPNVALKGEYQTHEENRLDLWVFSFSLLF